MGEDPAGRMAAAKKLHEKARYLRGRFLNSVAVIERDIAIILTEYFCREDDEKRDVFFRKVAERLSLHVKREILIDILKNDYPRYWEDEKEVFAKMSTIQEFRNKLAHSVVDVSDEALDRPLEDGVGFIQWRGGRPITDQEFEALNVSANMVVSALDDIRRLLPFKEC